MIIQEINKKTNGFNLYYNRSRCWRQAMPFTSSMGGIMTFRQSAILFLAAMTLAGCVTLPDSNPLAIWSPSENFDDRKPRLIILHATEMDSAERALQVLKSQNPSGRVSAHYLISEDGKIFQLVEDTKRAWHAGAGRWHQINDINSVSI